MLERHQIITDKILKSFEKYTDLNLEEQLKIFSLEISKLEFLDDIMKANPSKYKKTVMTEFKQKLRLYTETRYFILSLNQARSGH